MKTRVQVKYCPPNHRQSSQWYIRASWNNHEDLHMGFSKKPTKKQIRKCLKKTIKRMKAFDAYYMT